MMLFACMPLIHMGMGLAMILGFGGLQEAVLAQAQSASESAQQTVLVAIMGWFLLLSGFAFFIVGQAISISVIVSGRFIKRRTRYKFSFVLACIACIFVPFGTVLGVFTIIVLSRDAVKAKYGRLKAATIS